MTRYFKYFLFLLSTIVVFSCKDAEEAAAEVIIPFEAQYPIDLEKIETFLKTHSYNSGTKMFELVANGSATSIWGSNPAVPKPTLLSKIVNGNGINYKVYYVMLQVGANKRPTGVDNVSVSYKGQLLDKTVFDENNGVATFGLGQTIFGWQTMFPLFKSATVSQRADGTVDYISGGEGFFFLPSALAYYNRPQGSIPAYSPLIFSIKLYDVNYVDNEGDQIQSVYEDLDNDGNPFNDDSDGDGVPNFGDIDDDADYIPTNTEIKRPARNLVTGAILLDVNGGILYNGFYPYNGAAQDDPITDNIDERQGIPRKFTGQLRDPSSSESASNRRQPQQSDYTDPNRLRRHMDASSKPPYE